MTIQNSQIKISIITVIGRNRELGRDNKLLWHISEDLKRFKKITQGHAVIMGRKTFESLGKPLPNRLNVIITRDKNYQQKVFDRSINRLIEQKILICSSLEKGIKIGKLFEKENNKDNEELFIIGGGQVYQQGLPYADKLYLTLVDADCPEADTYFPDYSTFNRVTYEEKRESEGLKYTFLELVK